MEKRGKINFYILILIFIIVSIAIIHFVIALENPYNKSYNPATKTITISNNSGLREKLADITLIDNTDYCLKHCSAVIRLDLKKDYKNPFEQLDFYRIENRLIPVNLQEYKILLRNGSYQIEVDDYGNVCVDGGKLENGTIPRTCEFKKTGSHIETKYTYKNYNGEELQTGIYYFKIEGIKKLNEVIEWIPTFLNTEITEWAVWSASMNIGLVSYYNFDENSEIKIIDRVRGWNNGTLINVSGLLPIWTPGLLGSALNFSGSNYVQVNDSNSLDMQNISISLWIKSYDSPTGTDDINIISKDKNNDRSWTFGTDASPPGNRIRFYLSGSGSSPNYIAGGNLTSNTSWYHIVAIRNDTTLSLYLDNSLIASASNPMAIPITAAELYIGGRQYSPSIQFHGAIDEVGIWNRTLSIQEISDLYNNGIGITYAVDIIPPETSIPEIIPTQPKTSDNLECYATLTDNEQINLTAYWKWYKNNIENLSGDTTVQNSTYSNITTLNSIYTLKGEQWKCEVTPFDGNNYGTAKNSSVTILNSPPNQTTPLLKTPSGKNLSTENLTCYNQSTFDADNDNVTNIYNWYKNSHPLAVLNMPFEINAKDYSGYSNNGTIYGNPQFVTGKVGRALSFDGIDDYVSTSYSPNLTFRDNITIEAWFKTNNIGGSSSNDNNIVHYGEYDEALLYINNGQICGEVVTGGWYSNCFSSLSTNTWYHVALTYKASDGYFSAYLNGNLVGTKTTDSNLLRLGFLGYVYIARNGLDNHGYFNGSIDEVRIYNYTLTPEQIKQRYEETKDGLTSSSTIVSQETSAGDKWMCQVTPNDAEEEGITKNSSTLNINWKIIFNVTSGEDGSQISNFNINCNNSFSALGVSSPYETGFLPGSYECTFSKTDFFNKTQTFLVDNNKTVNVKLSVAGKLTTEEHSWLEALYNCIIKGECEAFEMWKSTNQTVFDIWKRVTRTNREVVTQENIISNILNTTSNITINYTIQIPFKQGYSNGELLPLRMFFWLHNGTKCYNQDKRTDSNRAESPYCFPLVAETLGPNNGSVSFVVDLRPDIPNGTYNITRTIEIDPVFEGVRRWINYGQEIIGQIIVFESGEATIELTNTGKSYSSNGWPSITGSVIGTIKEFFTNNNWIFIIILSGIVCITIVIHSYFKYVKRK